MTIDYCEGCRLWLLLTVVKAADTDDYCKGCWRWWSLTIVKADDDWLLWRLLTMMTWLLWRLLTMMTIVKAADDDDYWLLWWLLTIDDYLLQWWLLTMIIIDSYKNCGRQPPYPHFDTLTSSLPTTHRMSLGFSSVSGNDLSIIRSYGLQGYHFIHLYLLTKYMFHRRVLYVSEYTKKSPSRC